MTFCVLCDEDFQIKLRNINNFRHELTYGSLIIPIYIYALFLRFTAWSVTQWCIKFWHWVYLHRFVRRSNRFSQNFNATKYGVLLTCVYRRVTIRNSLINLWILVFSVLRQSFAEHTCVFKSRLIFDNSKHTTLSIITVREIKTLGSDIIIWLKHRKRSTNENILQNVYQMLFFVYTLEFSV